MAAISKNFSAQYAYAKHMTRAKIPVRRLCGYRLIIRLKHQRIKSPTPIAKTKKPTAFNSVIQMLPPPLRPVMMLKVIMPNTSSMIAALKIVVPTFVFNLPSSRSVSTVMPTLVAAKIVPIKRAFISFP